MPEDVEAAAAIRAAFSASRMGRSWCDGPKQSRRLREQDRIAATAGATRAKKRAPSSVRTTWRALPDLL